MDDDLSELPTKPVNLAGNADPATQPVQAGPPPRRWGWRAAGLAVLTVGWLLVRHLLVIDCGKGAQTFFDSTAEGDERQASQAMRECVRTTYALCQAATAEMNHADAEGSSLTQRLEIVPDLLGVGCSVQLSWRATGRSWGGPGGGQRVCQHLGGSASKPIELTQCVDALSQPDRPFRF